MRINSSTSSSDGNDSQWASLRLLLRRAAIFAAPLVLVLVAMEGYLAWSGETADIDEVLERQQADPALIYLPMSSDRNFMYKLRRVQTRPPEVLVLGSSRVNQWRQEMYAPYSFYNAGSCAYTFRQFQRFLDALENDQLPRVLIIPVDFFMFHDRWDDEFRSLSLAEDLSWSPRERVALYQRFLQSLIEKPTRLFAEKLDPRTGNHALGMTAMTRGKGFRADGSIQYAQELLEREPVRSDKRTMERIRRGLRQYLRADQMDAGQTRRFQALARCCQHRGVALVAITPPYLPQVIDALEESPQHGIWREFHSPQMAQAIRDAGALYFDFHKIEYTQAPTTGFTDGCHTGELVHIHMLRSMLTDATFRALLPKLKKVRLEADIAQASTRLDVYGPFQAGVPPSGFIDGSTRRASKPLISTPADSVTR